MLVAVALTMLSGQVPADTSVVEERIDLYEPSTMAFLGTERTWYARDSRRLRLEITDGTGAFTLRFLVLHDRDGRESEAIYFEGDASESSREAFTYSPNERVQTTTYYLNGGEAGERTESVRDEFGREVARRYYRADGTMYGEEAVFWNPDGTKLGWDFRYIERDEITTFRYAYDDDTDGADWRRRTRSRDGVPERIEARSVVTVTSDESFLTPALFAGGQISTDESEASPSFSADGRTMVFARYGSDWTRKRPYVAYWEPEGWRVEPLSNIGLVYNLTISPDAQTVLYSTRVQEERRLFRTRRTSRGWGDPDDLTARFGVVGTYPCLTAAGDLVLYDSEDLSGPGIYVAKAVGDEYSEPVPVFVPAEGAPFDACTTDTETSFLLTRCFDEVCDSGSENGVWEVELGADRVPRARKLDLVSYVWGAQAVDALGVLVVTDGEDILTLPLRAVTAR